MLKSEAELKRYRERDTERHRESKKNYTGSKAECTYSAKSAKNEYMNAYFTNRSITGDDRTDYGGDVHQTMHVVGLFMHENG